MDYENILVEIGQFGRWQKIVVGLACICSFVEPFNTFGFTFIGFIPEFRCKIDICDGDNPTFKSDFVNFSIPMVAEGEPSQCIRYAVINGTCNSNSFSQDTEVCGSHVYDDSVYKNSYVAEFDLSPCNGADPSWIFGVKSVPFEFW